MEIRVTHITQSEPKDWRKLPEQDLAKITDKNEPFLKRIPNFDISEGLVGGKVSKSQTLDNAVQNSVVTGGGVITRLVVPAGALSDANTVVTVVNDPAGAPAAP